MIADSLIELIVSLGVPEDQITGDSYLFKDLALDSTEAVQLSLDLKRKFSVDVKMTSREDKTVREYAQLIETLVQQQSGEGMSS